MIEKLYFVYDVFDVQDTSGHRKVTGVSHYPLLDLKVLSALGYTHLAIIAGPLPLAWAVHEADRHKLRRQTYRDRQGRFARFLGSLTRTPGFKRVAARFDIATCHDCRDVILPAEEDLDILADVLQGRILFDREITQALLERGLHLTGNLYDILQTLILKGAIGRVPSVAVDRFRIASCRRCGNRDVVQAPCSACSSEKCLYCPKCASMGQARACRPLFYSPRNTASLRNVIPGQDVIVSQNKLPGEDDPAFKNEISNIDAAALNKAIGKARTAFRNPLAVQESTEPPNASSKKDFEVRLPFELTKAQQHASQLVTDFLENPTCSECLVFAVCGAGKTEVVFQTIAQVLRHGGKVLLAIPRSDVVAEIVPRIASAIPDASILELRGQAKSRYRDADIVVATTHQTIRFFQAFDLVVLDEVDAFPYRGSAILNYAVRRATAPWGNTVFMTATPGRELLRKADRKEIALVRIPARHHGRPLPEPEIIQTRLPLPDEVCRGNSFRGILNRNTSASEAPQGHDKSGQVYGGTGRIAGCGLLLPDKVLAIIERSLAASRKMFVFVPTVELSRLVSAGISASLHVSGYSPADSRRTILRDSSQPRTPRIASIHAAHPNRELHREAFRTGPIDIIVSTSVLERGITVPNADVLVLYADYERIFDTATLIQMAGRAGRTEDDTQAKVYFAARQVTASMRDAIRLIQDMNRHAAESGYLRPPDIGSAASPQASMADT